MIFSICKMFPLITQKIIQLNRTEYFFIKRKVYAVTGNFFRKITLKGANFLENKKILKKKKFFNR